MTTYTCTFTTDEDGEELMYRIEREFGIEFDEFHEVPEAQAPKPEPTYVEHRVPVMLDTDNGPYEATAIFSVPNVTLDEIAVTGKVRVVAAADDFFGGGTDYKSDILTSPTWRELMGVFAAQMATTFDVHHAFLEGIINRRVEDDVKVIEFALGS
jgi:hypothetical protein